SATVLGFIKVYNGLCKLFYCGLSSLTMWVCSEDSSGWASKVSMWGFPHSYEPNEGELWVGLP
ncbi:MAG: hypothetical protein QXS63_04390, partial [Zestosphaera sp.]